MVKAKESEWFACAFFYRSSREEKKNTLPVWIIKSFLLVFFDIGITKSPAATFTYSLYEDQRHGILIMHVCAAAAATTVAVLNGNFNWIPHNNKPHSCGKRCLWVVYQEQIVHWAMAAPYYVSIEKFNSLWRYTAPFSPNRNARPLHVIHTVFFSRSFIYLACILSSFIHSIGATLQHRNSKNKTAANKKIVSCKCLAKIDYIDCSKSQC